MLLKNLIKKSYIKFKNLKIRGLAVNSKKVKKGFIFFAIKGHNSNGEKYISEAINNGAKVIVCSEQCNFKNDKIDIIKSKNVRKTLSEIISKFYKKKPKNIIAVTGTNGKTSVADFFYQILEKNNIPVASIGTLGIHYKNKTIKTDLTSPDIITLHRNLEQLKKNNINNVIIEASSHGLAQKRLDKIIFKAGVFTNFSQDHLDYHKTMKNYLNSKLILFKKLLPNKSTIITDKTIKEYSVLKKIAKKRNLKILDINQLLEKANEISPNIIGTFQLKNLSMAIQAAKKCNLKEQKIFKAIKSINVVKGRLNLVKEFENNIKVFVDYAHTPEALKTTLQALKDIYNSKITLVFGCGGERDFKKRPLMAKIAKKFCKKIYVTDDNPRKENPKKIRSEIVSNLKGSNYHNIANRSQAIKKAILNSEYNEIILVAGKGHEANQDYGNRIINISDIQIIKSIKKILKKEHKKKRNFFFNSNILNKVLRTKKNYKFSGVAIDSRDVKKNNIFLAIKGKNNDGNKFISKAIKKGARYIVSAKKNINFKNNMIKCKNIKNFLNNFAKLKRNNCNSKIIAITGSIGKTSLKNTLNILLQQYGKTFASPRSFNNHYGVPLSLSNLNYDTKFGIFEVGMSKLGEIDKLSKIINPNLAVITNIAEAHIENFKNLDGIARAKSEIINNIKKNGSLILNHDDKYYNFLKTKAESRKIKVVSFGKSKNSDVRLINIKEKKGIKKITIKISKNIFDLKVKNINLFNILAAFAVLKVLNLDLKKVLKTIKNLEPYEGRGKIHKVKRYNKKFTLIDESYNASPFSVKIAINNFSQIRKGKSKKYLLLGDMLELGKNSEIYHEELSKVINSSDIDKVFVKGEKTIFTYKNLDKNKCGNIIQYNQDFDMLLKNIIANNDYLMIKGSNATGLNTISKSMIKGNNVI